MPRFVLRYQGSGDGNPDAEMEHLCTELNRTIDSHILDKTPNMLLVEGDEKVLRDVVERWKNWKMFAEVTTAKTQ